MKFTHAEATQVLGDIVAEAKGSVTSGDPMLERQGRPILILASVLASFLAGAHPESFDAFQKGELAPEDKKELTAPARKPRSRAKKPTDQGEGK